MHIGILSLQGAVAPHLEKLNQLGVSASGVRTEAEIEACAGLILPGGESTTLLNLIGHYGLRRRCWSLRRRARCGAFARALF